MTLSSYERSLVTDEPCDQCRYIRGRTGMSDWVNAAKGSAKRFRVGLGANELDIEIRIDPPGATYAFRAMIDRQSSG